MVRRWLVVLTGVVMLAVTSADLAACGDKFLRAGRSGRIKNYAAVYPASIIVFAPRATAKGVREFESLLKKAGHKPVALRDRAALAQTLATGGYELVIAETDDLALVRTELNGASTELAVLPMVSQADAEQDAELARQYTHLLRPAKMTKIDALEQIDGLMKLRRDGSAAGAASR